MKQNYKLFPAIQLILGFFLVAYGIPALFFQKPVGSLGFFQWLEKYIYSESAMWYLMGIGILSIILYWGFRYSVRKEDSFWKKFTEPIISEGLRFFSAVFLSMPILILFDRFITLERAKISQSELNSLVFMITFGIFFVIDGLFELWPIEEEKKIKLSFTIMGISLGVGLISGFLVI